MFLFCCTLSALARLAFTQATCDSVVPGPLSLPIKNVTLQTHVVRRGVEIAIGTPPQPLAFVINSFFNNTYLFDADSPCGSNETAIRCLALNGGDFEPAQSSTWKTTTSLPTEDAGIATVGDVFGTDTILLNASTPMAAFPVGIDRNAGIMDMNSVGLGPSSTLLAALKSAGVIASRSYSIFWGLTGEDNTDQMDGSLVLGGYDEAKLGGANLTQALSNNPNCPTNMIVTVTDIQVTSGSLLGTNKGSALLFCIEPDFELITVPDDIWQQFLVMAGGTGTGGLDGNNRSYGINVFGEDFLATDVYDGDLTFVIDNQLEITIPNSQLVQRDISIDSEGVTFFNESVKEVMLNDLEQINANDIPILGMTFLQAAYLSVNLDESTFTLWPVLPTTEEQLVGLGQRNISGCVTPPSPSTNTTTTSPPSAASSKASSSSKLSSSAIAGIAIGAVGLIVLSALLAFYLLQRKRRRTMQDPSAIPMMEERSNTATMHKPELEAQTYSMSGPSFTDSKKYSYDPNKPLPLPAELPGWMTPRGAR